MSPYEIWYLVTMVGLVAIVAILSVKLIRRQLLERRARVAAARLRMRDHFTGSAR